MSLSASVNDQRCRFNTKVAELRATQGKNVRMFTDDEYHEYLRKVKDIRSPGHRMVPSLLKLWPDCQMINGKARHSQSQGSVERCNRDIENMLACWQVDNWAYGLQFVQYAKNARYHTGIGRSPFMAQLGYEAQLGVKL